MVNFDIICDKISGSTIVSSWEFSAHARAVKTGIKPTSEKL
jgi:hypothetical protein